MVRTRAIPRNLVIDGFPVKISYPGQAPVCDICGELDQIARNCALRGEFLECRQPGHLQRNCPVRFRRLQRSADPGCSNAAPSRSDAPVVAADASLSNDDPSSAVFSGVPPVDSRIDQPEGSASQFDLSDPPAVNPRSNAPGVAPGPSRPKDDSSSVVLSGVLSVDLRNNQLDEISSQSILADLPAVHCGPAVSESDMISCQIGSPQLVAETQIPNLPTSVVDQTPVIGSSQVQIPNSVTAAPAFAGDQPVNVIDNVISSDGLIISSDNDSESISEYTSESINKVTSESINEYTSESINANTSESSNLIS